MLSEYEKELLTAFVDGEMTRRQRQAVLRLLHQSSEARAFLRDLQENAHLFKLAPHRKLEESFADHVLCAISARGLRSRAPSPIQKLRRRWPLWLSAAAAIVLAVGVWYGAGPPIDPNATHDHAHVAPEPPRKVTMKLKELAQPDKRESFRKELERDSNVHLALAVQHGTQAVQRLVEVLKENELVLDVTSVAAASIRENKPSTQYVVYAEGIRPDEVVAMLQLLGTDPQEQGGFESVVLTPMNSQSRQQLNDVGVQVPQGNRIDRKPERPPIAKLPAFPTPKRLAVVLTNAPESGAGFAPEVQAFLDSRRELSPGTMQVLVLVTPARA